MSQSRMVSAAIIQIKTASQVEACARHGICSCSDVGAIETKRRWVERCDEPALVSPAYVGRGSLLWVCLGRPRLFESRLAVDELGSAAADGSALAFACHPNRPFPVQAQGSASLNVIAIFAGVGAADGKNNWYGQDGRRAIGRTRRSMGPPFPSKGLERAPRVASAGS